MRAHPFARLSLTLLVAAFVAAALPARAAQAPPPPGAPAGPGALPAPQPTQAIAPAPRAAAGAVVGVGPYLHLIDDLDRSLAFYRAVLGTEPGGSAESLSWSRNEQVAVMYGAPGAEIRTATLPVPGSPMPVELVAWRGVQSRPRVTPRVVDPGAAVLLLFVRDIDGMVTAATAAGGTVVTPGGRPIALGSGRFVMLRDPDGFFIELLQIDPMPPGALPTGRVALARFRTTAADAVRTRRFYADALGFELPEAGAMRVDPLLNGIMGTGARPSRLVTARIPGTALAFEIADYGAIATVAQAAPAADTAARGGRAGRGGRAPARTAGRGAGAQAAPRPSPVGIGGSMLRLQVADIDAVFARVTAAGARPVTRRPITLKDNRRMVIVHDPDGLLVQLWQVAPQGSQR